MKKVLLKLDEVAHSNSYDNLLNRKELLNGLEILKKLFSTSLPQDFLLENIIKLKNNRFYQQFKLDGDPCYIKELLDKVNDIKIIKLLLKSSEIEYSQQEGLIIKQHLNLLNSLFILEQELNRKHHDELFDVYLKDLEKLKEMLSTELICFKDVQWFFDSEFFKFISSTTDCDKELLDLYKTLLEKIEIKTRKDFANHLELLKTKQEKNSINYKEYYNVLSATKKQLLKKIRNAPIILKPIPNDCISEKFFAKDALSKNLKNDKDSTLLVRLKP